MIPAPIQVNNIKNLVYTIRDKQVMLDYDLDDLYGYDKESNEVNS